MLIVFIRSVLLYVMIIFSVRLMGKRQIGELQPSELVITILVSNIATLPIEDISIPLSMGLIPILTLVSLDVIMSALTLKSRRLRKIVSGSPKIVIENGKLKPELLSQLRFSADDLLEGLRSQGVFDISEVEQAVVETTGAVSVCLKKESEPPTSQDLGVAADSTPPPVLVIDSGKPIMPALKHLGFDLKWLQSTLAREGKRVSEVFLMTADRGGRYYYVTFEGKAGK